MRKKERAAWGAARRQKVSRVGAMPSVGGGGVLASRGGGLRAAEEGRAGPVQFGAQAFAGVGLAGLLLSTVELFVALGIDGLHAAAALGLDQRVQARDIAGAQTLGQA